MNINDTIHNELEEFKNLLADLAPAVQLIERERQVKELAAQTIDNITQKYEALIAEIQAPLQDFLTLASQNKDIIQKIDTVDFPTRLDRLEGNVNQTIQDVLKASEAFSIKTEGLIDKIDEVDFPSKFEGVEKRITDTLSELQKANEQHIQQTKAINEAATNEVKQLYQKIEEIDFPVKFDTLLDKVNSSLKSMEMAIETLRQETKEHNQQINQLNLPNRLEKIDATVSSVNAGIQNIQTRIENLESNLKENQNNALEKVLNRLNELENKNKNWLTQVVGIINGITFGRLFGRRNDEIR